MNVVYTLLPLNKGLILLQSIQRNTAQGSSGVKDLATQHLLTRKAYLKVKESRNKFLL